MCVPPALAWEDNVPQGVSFCTHFHGKAPLRPVCAPRLVLRSRGRDIESGNCPVDAHHPTLNLG